MLLQHAIYLHAAGRGMAVKKSKTKPRVPSFLVGIRGWPLYDEKGPMPSTCPGCSPGSWFHMKDQDPWLPMADGVFRKEQPDGTWWGPFCGAHAWPLVATSSMTHWAATSGRKQHLRSPFWALIHILLSQIYSSSISHRITSKSLTLWPKQ